MGRKVYMTEDQLNEILSGAYLDDYSSDGNIKDGDYTEVTTNPVKGGEPVTSDEYAKERGARDIFMGRYRDLSGVYPAAGALTLEKKNINEAADGVKNKKYKVSGPLRDKMMRNYQSTGGRTIGTKRLEKLLSDEGASENYLSNLLSDIKSGNVSQEEMQLLGGDDFVRWMDRNIKNRQTADAGIKKSQHDMGMDNVYQKAGGSRNNGGTAHTPKNNGTITYYGQ
jgi:hypothetical protein